MRFSKLVGIALVAAAMGHALTLEQARVLANRSHPNLQILEAEIDASQAAKLGAGTRANPELTIGPGIVRSTSDGQAGYRLRGELGLSQTFEFPGKRSHRILAAEGQVRLRQIALDGFRQQLAIQVRQTFVQGLVAKEIATLREQQLATAETFVKSAKNRVAGGYASAFESVQAQSDRIAAAQAVSQVHGRLKELKSSLAVLMGVPTDSSFELEGNLDSLLASGDVDEPFAHAMVGNPTIQASTIIVESATNALSAAHLASKPDLTVSPAVEVSSDEQALSVGLSIPLPVWNRGRAEVAAATADQRRALAEQKKVKQEVAASILACQGKIANARERLAMYTPEFLGELKSLMERSEKVYDQNATSLLIYLESRRSYYASLSDYYETIGQLAQAQGELSAAIGISEKATTETKSVGKQ